MLNALSLLIVGLYTGAVILHGNLNELLALLGEEIDFLKWAVALGIIFAIANNPNMGLLGKGLASLAVAGLASVVINNKNFAALVATINGKG